VEERIVFETGRLDPLGYCRDLDGDLGVGHRRVGITFE